MTKHKIEYLCALLHKLNNIATIESCYAQLLQSKDLDEESKKYIETIIRTNNRFTPVFEDIATLLEEELKSLNVQL